MSSVDRVAVLGTPGAPAGSDPVLRALHLSVRATPARAAIEDVSLDVRRGEMVVVAGPPGSGAKTLVRVIGGEDAPDAGRIEGPGPAAVVRAGDLPPDRTAVGAVAARSAEPGERDRVAAARRLLGQVGLTDGADRRPVDLDAGQRLRLGLARALAGGSRVVVLDDPLAGVDGRARVGLRRQLRGLQRELGFAAVCSCRRGNDAVELADRLAVMSHGRLVQSGEPREVYDEPVSAEVATFLGAANQVPGRVVATATDGADGVVVATPLGEMTGRSGAGGLAVGEPVVVLWRPERTRLARREPPGPNRWAADVDATLHLGAHTQHAARVAGHRLLVWQAAGAGGAEHRGWLSVHPDDVRVLPATGGTAGGATGPSTGPPEGARSAG